MLTPLQFETWLEGSISRYICYSCRKVVDLGTPNPPNLLGLMA